MRPNSSDVDLQFQGPAALPGMLRGVLPSEEPGVHSFEHSAAELSLKVVSLFPSRFPVGHHLVAYAKGLKPGEKAGARVES